MCQMTEFTPYGESHYSYMEPHRCDKLRGEGEIKLACGCMVLVLVRSLADMHLSFLSAKIHTACVQISSVNV